MTNVTTPVDAHLDCTDANHLGSPANSEDVLQVHSLSSWDIGQIGRRSQKGWWWPESKRDEGPVESHIQI